MDAPEGTLSMLFSDIEGSTKLLEHLGDGYADALIAHNQIVRSALAMYDGWERHTEGDAFFIVFRRAATRCSPAPRSSAVSSSIGGRAPRRCGSASASTRVSRVGLRVATTSA
jgi:class 3 adenylate cyclase